MSDLKLGAPDCLEKHSEIKQTVASVKAQEDQLMDRLTNEQICLERELQIGKVLIPNKPHCEKTSFLYMRKQRRRSASR